MEERILFCEVDNINSLCCILGLSFPESATEFQRAALTLAHLMASVRDFVLKGVQLPDEIVCVIAQLEQIIEQNKNSQR